MSINNIKTLYTFLQKKKVSTILTVLLFLIVALLDSILIFLSEYEIKQILLNFTITQISKILLILIIIRLFFKILIINNNKIQLLNVFITSLKIFFSSLIYNKSSFGQSKTLENILKFQWEIKFISNEINSYYIKILTNISYFTISLISISKILLTHQNQDNIISFLIAIFSLILICIIHFVELKFEINNFKLIENSLSFSNSEIIKFINDEKIQNNNNNYKIFINTQLKKIKSIFIKIFVKKSFIEFLFFFTNFLSLILISYSASLSIQKNNNSIFFSFIIYNLAFIYFGFQLYKNTNEINKISLISQNNSLLLKNDQDNEKEENKIFNSGNQIVIESIEFQDVNLKSENNLLINNINFFATTKDNIIFISSNDNISLIKEFFQNYKIKTSGSILINNHNLNNLDQQNLNDLIATISSDTQILNDTIKNNITMGENNLSDEIIIKASKLTYLYNFIISLPLGFYTILNNSITLTKIEKFQISLTRALLSDAHIIIVDFTKLNEEDQIIESIKDMLLSSIIDRILIIISKSTFDIKKMSQIIFYENENIICHGTHDELIIKNKKYSDFYLKNYNKIEFNE
jgi:ABC-type multidrug transport system fused ATPase/permease subunit